MILSVMIWFLMPPKFMKSCLLIRNSLACSVIQFTISRLFGTHIGTKYDLNPIKMISNVIFQWSLSNHIEPYLVNDTSNHPLADMQIFLTDPWKFLEQPLAVYQEAELLKGHEFDKKKARTDMTPFISSLLNTRNPQVTILGAPNFEVSIKCLVGNIWVRSLFKYSCRSANSINDIIS